VALTVLKDALFYMLTLKWKMPNLEIIMGNQSSGKRKSLQSIYFKALACNILIDINLIIKFSKYQKYIHNEHVNLRTIIIN